MRHLPRLLTGVDGRQYTSTIPPDRLHPDVVAQMRADAIRLLAPAFAEVMTKARQPMLQPIVDSRDHCDDRRPRRLVGDAAFVARPHVGMGTTKAAGDARALADRLARHDDIDAALAAYGAERLDYGRRVVRRGRHLGGYMQAQIASEESSGRRSISAGRRWLWPRPLRCTVWRIGECNAASTVVRVLFQVSFLASAEGFGLP